MKQETEVWLAIAKEDYKNMQAMKESQSLRGAVLFAQQCVEKVLRHILLSMESFRQKKFTILRSLLKRQILT